MSGHTSRRSSLGSMGLPEHFSLPEPTPSAEALGNRHNLMPGWQVTSCWPAHACRSTRQRICHRWLYLPKLGM